MSDYIKREDVFDAIERIYGKCDYSVYSNLFDEIDALPSADVVEREVHDIAVAEAEIKGIDSERKRLLKTWERKHGEWIFHEDWKLDGECAYECPFCGRTYDYAMNFCGYCGVDMREREGE